MTAPRLGIDADVPIRIAVWTAVVVVAVVAVEPVALELPGAPLVGLAAIGVYLALAHFAIRVTAGVLSRAATMPVFLFGHGVAVFLGGLGSLPVEPGEAVRFVSLRLGAVLIGLGLPVLVIGAFASDRAAVRRAQDALASSG